RGMNMLYETMRAGVASVIVVPSSALDSMNLGTIGGLQSLMAQNPADGRRQAPSPPAPPAQHPSPSASSSSSSGSWGSGAASQPRVQMPVPTQQPPSLPPLA